MASPSTVPPNEYRGRKLGDFVLRELIGSGSFGAIYAAEQPALAREVVVKVLRSTFASDERMQRRFEREARLASTLDHPYAAHVYAFGVEADGVPWIAMELVRGTPLDQVLRARRMPLPEFVPFFERLCEVVHTAHEHGIVHRDIKPQNVMVVARAGALLPKLLDLGIAKDAATSRTSRAAHDGGATATVASNGQAHAVASLTGLGDLMGSPAYMAPEQWTDGDQVDARTDVYALGVLAYETIAGRRPFGGSTTQLAEQHLLADVPALPDDVSAALHPVLERAMAKEPGDRFATALDLAAAVRDASGLSGGGVPLPTLDRALVDAVVRDAPQPIAEAIVEIDAAPSAFGALEAAGRFARVTTRLLALVALSAWSSRGGERTPAVIDALAALRARRLEDDEWLDLLRALAASLASRAKTVPLPDEAAIGALADLAHRTAGTRAARRTERAAADELAAIVPIVESVLRSLAVFGGHPLGVATDDGRAELWTGVRRKRRVARALDAGSYDRDDAVLLSPDGRALRLAPLLVARAPSPNAEREVFLLDGRGRRGVTLVAPPSGFEQTSDAAQAWLARHVASADETELAAAPLEAPYRGLAPLTAADADVFFGREREVEAFLNRLRGEPLLVVVGPSGAGKSSFVRAGVLPSLDASFQSVVLRPGTSPLAALRATLTRLGIDVGEEGGALDADALAARTHAAARARDVTFVLVVDQLEEAFTLARDGEARAAFFALLAALGRSASDPVRVVLTVRDDFLARLQEEGSFESRLEYSIALLATPGPAALRRILVEPARRAGFAFESDALVDAMVREVAGRPGALALLSFAAAKLWERRDAATRTLTSRAYDDMGGVGGALAQHGEAVLDAMVPKHRSLVRTAFRRLVTAEGTRATVPRDELLAALGDDDAARAVMEQLVAARLVVIAEGDDDVEQVEVIHEALLAAWPRLVEWRREDEAGTRLRAKLRDAAQQWKSHGKPRSLLWRGALLDEYRAWRARREDGLTPTEEAFASESLAEKTVTRIAPALPSPAAATPPARADAAAKATGEAASDVSPPKTWAKGRIAIGRQIGAGGMGVVYEGFDRERNARVAVKALHKMDADSLVLFKREFRVLQDIQHENLVQYGELFEEEGAWFFTMELLDGVDLLTYVRGSASPGRGQATVVRLPTIRQGSGEALVAGATSPDGARADVGTFDEARLRDAFIQLTRGLVEVHKARKVHRDIKPSNVLVTRDGGSGRSPGRSTPEARVVILDFGVAMDARDASARAAGTAAFMAPEQALGEALGAAADVYAVGATLYVALTGRAPFEGSAMEIVTAKMERLPPRPIELNPRVPRDLDELCMRMLAFAPEDRPSDAEILRRLAPDAASSEPPSTSVSTSDFFVGRARELAALRAAFDETRRGETGILLVHGESGVGKSALVRSFTSGLAAAEPAMLTLSGRCFERESVPYKAVDEVLDAVASYLAERPSDEVAPLVPADVALLVRVFPALRGVPAFASAADERAAAPGDVQQLRARVFVAVRSLFDALARGRTVVVCIDDLQWADADSLALLGELLRAPGAPPLLLLATVRTSSDDARILSVADLARRLGDRARDLRVDPLSREESVELVELLTAGASSRAVAAASIAKEAAGHPLFIAELVRQRRDGDARAVRLDDALWERVSALDAGARELLEVVALAGAPIPQDVAAEVVALPPSEMMRVAGVLRVSHLVRTSGPRLADVIEAYHDRVRETVATRSRPEEKKRWHRRLAEVLETRRRGDAETLATHWAAAGEPAKALEHFVVAADHAVEVLAFNRAAELYARAIELVARDPERVHALSRQRAEALSNAGRAAEAAAIFSELAARGLPADALEMNRRAAMEYLKSGHIDAGMVRLREVLAAVGMRLAPNVFVAVLSLLIRRAFLWLRGFDFRPRPVSEVPEALRLRLDVTWMVSMGLATVEPIHAADFHARAMILSLASGDREWVARNFCVMTAPIALEGRRTARRSRRMIAMCHELTEGQSPYLRGLAWLTDGCARYGTGHWRDAVEKTGRAYHLFNDESTGSTFERNTASMFHVASLFNAGELRRMKERRDVLLDDARQRGDLYSEYYLNTAYMMLPVLADDRPVDARERIATLVERWSRRGFHVQHWWALLGEMLIDLYERKPTAAYGRLTSQWSALRRSLMLELEIVRIEAQDLRARAALAMAQSAPDPGPLLREAARFARKLEREQVPHASARARAIRAALRAHRGDLPRAIEMLEEAEREFRAQDMALFAATSQRRRGEVLGGEKGRALVEAADAHMRAEGIVRPEHVTDVLAPWFPSRSA